MFKKFKNILNNTQEWFALLGMLNQLGIVLIVSFLVIFVSSFLVGSIESTYTIFVDPPALFTDEHDSTGLAASFVLMLIGLVITGFIISILSSSLENTFRDIRTGRLNYNGSDHTIIINYNNKIANILEELNLLHHDHNDMHDVVILIDDEENVEKLQSHIKQINQRFNHLRISIRYGDVMSWQRYLDISILSAYSIIILSNDKIKDNFLADNNTLRIINLLFREKELKNYLQEQKDNCTPVKAIVELENLDQSAGIVKHISSSLFIPISPNIILSSILNLSMINIDFFNLWSELLSFKGYELYFVSADEKGLVGCSYKNLLLRHKEGLLLGISRKQDSKIEILLNAQEDTIKSNDWLIFIAKDKMHINFEDTTYSHTPKLEIAQPKEIYVKDILIIGDKQNISPNELLDMDKSNVIKIIAKEDQLYCKDFYDEGLNKYNTIIINLDDESIYRIALVLREYYNNDIPTAILFLVDDSKIAKYLFEAGIKNTILSHILISKYITQVSNQLALYDVFNILFTKAGPEINFIDINNFDEDSLNDVNQLKVELINSGMVYLGCEIENGETIFEADDLSDAKKIIVFSNGDF